MQLREIIIIYLAIAAPFGVSYFLSRQSVENRAWALVVTTGRGLSWPFLVVHAILGRHKRASFNQKLNESFDLPRQQRLVGIRRELRCSLYNLENVLHNVSMARGDATTSALRTISQSVERYAGLALAIAEEKCDKTLSAHETELCRIAGRTGEDLLLAGRCIRRRNAARLGAHLDRSRMELLHALAEMREVANGDHSSMNALTLQQLSEALLQLFGHAIEFFSSSDDQSAALRVSRLLDAECARLRQLEKDARQSTHGEQVCQTASSNIPRLPQSPTLLPGQTG